MAPSSRNVALPRRIRLLGGEEGAGEGGGRERRDREGRRKGRETGEREVYLKCIPQKNPQHKRQKKNSDWCVRVCVCARACVWGGRACVCV